MRKSVFALVLLSALVASTGLAMRYEPREPDPQPYQPPCDVVSIWKLFDSAWIKADDSQIVRKGPTTQPRRGDQWLTACDTNCELDNLELNNFDLSNFEQTHPRSRYLVNDQRHSDASSLTDGFPPQRRFAVRATPLDDWYQTCGDLNDAIKHLN